MKLRKAGGPFSPAWTSMLNRSGAVGCSGSTSETALPTAKARPLNRARDFNKATALLAPARIQVRCAPPVESPSQLVWRCFAHSCELLETVQTREATTAKRRSTP
jgi:hypothetical protein